MIELTVLSSLISIALLMVLLFWLYPDYRTDVFRQKMFRLRDDLFDEAVKGKISFNDQAYGMLRNAMNGHIRFAHQSNVWQVLLFALFTRNDQKVDHPFQREFDKNTAQCSPEQREIYLKYYIKMIICFCEHLILSSVILTGMVIPLLLLWYVTRLQITKFTNLLKRWFDKLNTMALETGKA